ncbi:ATP-binding protein [Nitrospirillum sp. BR 11164]|uniref:ATP-binding protein n=1 Tax=Nitrospirillum sp. BR 11164 TaxID=3104324 RepID=UPI002AFE53A2|nr:ATP-binding protein [Nitrospirillum sp. BR 11164]MEA1651176.1 ATP-binding protein [Nitrospirillum sp. BR 11164]
MHRTAAEGHRVLICAPYGRDAESVAGLLAGAGYHAVVHADIGALASGIDDETGVILLTEEALGHSIATLRAALAVQPDWSDIPVVLLAAQRTAQTRALEAARAQLWTLFSNALVLERPLSVQSLLSAVDTAMRSRQKQFEMRDRLQERDRARRALAENEAQLRLATDAAEIGFWDVDPVNGTLFWPPRVKAMFGISPQAQVSMADFYAGLHPEDAQATSQAFAAACDPRRRSLYDVEYRTIGKEDGVVRWVAAKGRAIFDDDDRCVRVIGTAIDVTRRKVAELELKSLNETLEERVAERTGRLMRAEAALRQSQKMEAVGQLTGGIAHDFNNMLTGIIGSLDIMRRRIAAGQVDKLDRYMDAATTSAQRAATLTARLLAFSRRQSLDAKPLDICRLIRSLEDLLRRTILETIELRIIDGMDLPYAVADANQLENAILNLVINARDAMPDGGQLTVETKVVDLDAAYVATRPEITIGKYVVITVSDTGVGMSADVIEKAFEPFFTTKPVGQGTGLGLSMVYGFARQSGGQVRIHSQPGVGTTVSIYLRAADAPPQEEAAAQAPALSEGKGQRVLVVEDDTSVRLLIRDVLEELSYEVEEAGEANAAITVLKSDRPISLMVSDVGLPGINGRQLAEIAREHRPNLPVIFVTGYAENAAIRAGFLGTNMTMITKPFTLEVLAAKVSEMMERGKDAAPPML